jgi:hypothetical protein
MHWDAASTWILVALLSLSAGWIGASLRVAHLHGQFTQLSGRQAESEAAIARYWDRVRKRMSIDHEQPAAPRYPDPSVLSIPTAR